MEIKLERNPNPGRLPADESTLGFGKCFTDHMLMIDWDKGTGWHDARIVPFGPLAIHPASTSLHYGAELFEGMKAYRAADGSIRMFRPIENCKRLNSSAERMCLPTIDAEELLDAIDTYVSLEKDWVPYSDGTSLYLRPFLIGDDPNLGVHAASHALLVVIASPSGSYYPTGLAPVSIMIEDEDVRAVRGGTGYTKCGGNYGASLRAGQRAEDKGFSQVLWLDGVERKYVEEVGAMNIMFKIAGKVVTPMLNGSILPGITRKSILELLRYQGLEPEERLVSVDELIEAAENGTLEEVWGCGTAAVVSPVGSLYYKGKEYVIGDGKIGAFTQSLYNQLTDIQWGRAPDPLGWVYPVK